ncbi:MAG: DUF2339 domain-containing protein [Thiohalocapsa sp.]
MDWDDFFPFALAIVAALGLAIKAMVDTRRLRLQLAELTEKFWMLDHRIVRLGEQLALPAPPAAAAEPPAMPPEPPLAEPPPAPEPAVAAEEPVLALAAPPTPAPAAGPGWEQKLVEHWLVWLGGATIALGGAFLVKLSIDYGLLTPLVRVILAILLGIALMAGAEWLRRREPPAAAPADTGSDGAASYVPQALAAAGAATIFASLYAAYALYGLLPPALAFPLLALTAIATVAQSLLQGPYVAALGLVGAYAVPLLVTSEAPDAVPLFLYLAVVTAASLALLRHRAWWWLAWLSLGGAIGWVGVWLANAPQPQAPVVALYLVVLLGLVAAFRHGIARVAFLAGTADSPIVRIVARTALWAIAVGFLFVAYADDFGMASSAAALVMMAALIALAWHDRELDDVIAIAGALALALLAIWSLPLPTPEMNLWMFRVKADRIGDFSAAAGVFALLLGGGGFLLLPRVSRPGRWAALSAAAPLLILVIAYWRLQKFELDVAWTLAALGLAAIELAAAASIARWRDSAAAAGFEPELEIEIALASYAVGVLGSTIFAATLALGEAWLTVALALHLPAMGWIDGRIRIPALRWLAGGVAAIVLVRLVANPYVLDYKLAATPVFNWLLYGYGAPAAAFVVATRQFGSRADDWLVWLLEAGSAAFTLLLLTFETTHAIYGELSLAPVDDFPAGAALIALWSAFGGAVYALGRAKARPVLLWGGLAVLGWATFVAMLWQPIVMLFGVRVGRLLILDALFLADLVPAVVWMIIAWQTGWPVLRLIARILAAAFAFAWVTLEIRHAFHAKVELFAASSEAEWYTYSVAWLLFAAAALAAGLVRQNRWLRQAGLIGLGLVIAKVFLSDMAELSGVLRALSFLGLGGALVALGYAYRRLRPLQPS